MTADFPLPMLFGKLSTDTVVLVMVDGACLKDRAPVPGAAYAMHRIDQFGATIIYVVDGYTGISPEPLLRKHGFPVPPRRHIEIVMRNSAGEVPRYFMDKLARKASVVGDAEGRIVATIGTQVKWRDGFFEWMHKKRSAKYLPTGMLLVDVTSGFSVPDPFTQAERDNLAALVENLWDWHTKSPREGGPLPEDFVATAGWIDQILSENTVHEREDGRYLSLPKECREAPSHSSADRFMAFLELCGYTVTIHKPEVAQHLDGTSKGDAMAVGDAYLKLK